MSNNLDEAIEKYKDYAECEIVTARVLRNNGNEKDAKYYEETAEFDEKMVAWLEELKQRREAERWVPVSEGLPKKEGKCLVTTDFGDVCEDSFRDGMFVLYLGNVIAWKYKPEPYKENKDDNKS